MKGNQKITRVQLRIDHDEEYILLGLVSAEPDYKLSQSINKKLAISLKNISPVKIGENTGHFMIFSRFSCSKGSPDTIYNLISNRSGKNFLLKKLKNIDYILLVHDSGNTNNADSLTSAMREIDTVNAVFNIDLSSFKDKNLQYIAQ